MARDADPPTGALSGWAPEPVTVTDVIDAGPSAAFAALLDLPHRFAPGVALPPLWQWLHFLERPAESELGEDGHPRDGHFLPPMPDRRRMIAGGRTEIRTPIRIGDEIVRRSALADLSVKSGRSGQLVFVTVRHEFLRDGIVLATEEQDVVYRSQPPGASRTLAAPPPDEHPSDWSLELHPRETTLFRFSALTYNGHRIHYDQPYATAVEGYPGLVVHGPLLALLLLEIPRRHLPDRTVAAARFRLHAPAFAGQAVHVAGRRGDADRIEVAARTDRVQLVSGEIRLRPT